MEKYLYFNSDDDAAFDAANANLCVAASRFRGFQKTQAGTDSLSLFFQPVQGQETIDSVAGGTEAHIIAETCDEVRLTITANKQREVMQAILAAIDAPKVSGTGKTFITVADAGRGDYLAVNNDSDGNAVAISGVGLYLVTAAASA